MDIRQGLYSSCVIVASLWSTTCAVGVEDDVIIEGEKSQQKPVQLHPQVGFQAILIVDDKGNKQIVQRQLVVGQEGLKARIIARKDRVGEFDNEQFNLQLFGHDNSPQKLKSRLNEELQASINEMDLTCELTPTQKKKLEMIGRADAKKLFDQVEELRSKRRDRAPNVREIEIFRTKVFGGVLGEGSFFQKSLPTVLTEEQFKKYSATSSAVLSVQDSGQDSQ